jgi:hypothetical protein
MKKLIKIQSELKAPKNQFNSFGKYHYRSNEDILEALKPLLAKNECLLTISDEIKEVNGVLFVEATATFTDGENTIETKAQAGIDIAKKGMDVSQCFGSSSSYARKYCLNAMFLIDDNKDADATNEHNSGAKNEVKKDSNADLPWLNKGTEQFDKVKVALKDGKATMADVRKKYRVSKEVETLLNS